VAPSRRKIYTSPAARPPAPPTPPFCPTTPPLLFCPLPPPPAPSPSPHLAPRPPARRPPVNKFFFFSVQLSPRCHSENSTPFARTFFFSPSPHSDPLLVFTPGQPSSELAPQTPYFFFIFFFRLVHSFFRTTAPHCEVWPLPLHSCPQLPPFRFGGSFVLFPFSPPSGILDFPPRV